MKSLRSLFTLVDSFEHIGSAVRAAEEFERLRTARDDWHLVKTNSAITSIPL